MGLVLAVGKLDDPQRDGHRDTKSSRLLGRSVAAGIFCIRFDLAEHSVSEIPQRSGMATLHRHYAVTAADDRRSVEDYSASGFQHQVRSHDALVQHLN